MRRLIAAVLLCAALAFGDEAADRTAVESVIHSLNTAKPPSTVFTADAQSDPGFLRPMRVGASGEVWSEEVPPVILVDSIKFLSADMAEVRATDVRLDRFPPKIPVLLLLKRDAGAWKIAVLRVTASGVF